MTAPQFEGDLLVNGTSLLTIGCIIDFSQIFQEAPLRGDNIKVPGVPGEIWVPKVRGAYDFTVQMTLADGVDVAAKVHALTLEKVLQLRDLLDCSTSKLTLTRRRPMSNGTIRNEECYADYTSGLEPELVGFKHGRVAINLRNISGGWFDGSTNLADIRANYTWFPVGWKIEDGFPPLGGINYPYKQRIRLYEDGTWVAINGYDPVAHGFPPPVDS